MNPYEMLRREEKANKLVVVLVEEHIDSNLAREMDASVWAVAAKKAKCKPPKSQTTIDLVIEKLALMEAAGMSRRQQSAYRELVGGAA